MDSGVSAKKPSVTSSQVAEHAGVSQSAVSRTFTEGASVSEGTRQKVLEATRKLGYQPNILARSLMTRRTELIGLVSNNFDNPAFMEIFDLFTRRLQQKGLQLQLTLPATPVSVQGDAQRLVQLFNNLLENSLRYTDGGGLVKVALTANEKHVRIDVEDSAPGVPAHASSPASPRPTVHRTRPLIVTPAPARTMSGDG